MLKTSWDTCDWVTGAQKKAIHAQKGISQQITCISQPWMTLVEHYQTFTELKALTRCTSWGSFIANQVLLGCWTCSILTGSRIFSHSFLRPSCKITIPETKRRWCFHNQENHSNPKSKVACHIQSPFPKTLRPYQQCIFFMILFLQSTLSLPDILLGGYVVAKRHQMQFRLLCELNDFYFL